MTLLARMPTRRGLAEHWIRGSAIHFDCQVRLQAKSGKAPSESGKAPLFGAFVEAMLLNRTCTRSISGRCRLGPTQTDIHLPGIAWRTGSPSQAGPAQTGIPLRRTTSTPAIPGPKRGSPLWR